MLILFIFATVKKLNVLLIRSYIGPFILTFCIALFVLVMQFLWKYIDDLVGKGLEAWVIFKLLFYLSATLVPMVLPLAILLSSIMTFGGLGEHYELTAIKSTGISLVRFMKPLIIGISMLSIGAFFFSNNVIPKANLKFGSLLYDIRRQKPTLNMQEGIFNNDIEGVSIKVGKKDGDGKTLYDLIIYDHTQSTGNDNVIIAKKGQMLQSKNGIILIMKLQNGVQYKEEFNLEQSAKFKMYITKFDDWEKRFDLSQFALQRTDEIFFKDVSHMLDISQLQVKIDSVRSNMRRREDNMHENLQAYLLFSNNYADSNRVKGSQTIIETLKGNSGVNILGKMPKAKKEEVLEQAIAKARNVKSYSSSSARDALYLHKDVNEFKVEIHRKFKLSVVCLLFFFIGAPLGAIIRKGGLGWPIFFSILIFICFYSVNMIGEKLAEDAVYQVFTGAWLSVIVLTPIALFLTVKANNDSALFNRETYTKPIEMILKKLRASK